jgi:hypothetical protein
MVEEPKLSKVLQIKVDNLLENFYKKIEDKKLSIDKEITIYEKINTKIEDIKIKYNNDFSKILLLDYLKEKITGRIDYRKEIKTFYTGFNIKSNIETQCKTNNDCVLTDKISQAC